MGHHESAITGLSLILTLTLTTACGPDPVSDTPAPTGTSAAALPAASGGPVLRVLSRNLYLGADVDSVIYALVTPTPDDDLPALVAAVQTFMATDARARCAAVAREIAWARPDIVGLQEVWAVELALPGLVTTSVDFLDLLRDELETLGLEYDVAVKRVTTEAQLPGVHLVDRDAILVRRGRVTVEAVASAPFAWNLGDPGAGFPILRAWTTVYATVAGRPVQLINAHLESGDDPMLVQLRAAQALELAQVASLDRPVVLLGDLNDVPGSPMHQVLQASGLVDVWTALRPNDDGGTCCFDGALSDPSPNLDQRIDYVLTRGFDHGGRSVQGWIHRIGLAPWERIDGPVHELWPSDHAGLSAGLVMGGRP
jgi:endonuclease/exonuclease/phosphatase family metal-dependent hydrolase